MSRARSRRPARPSWRDSRLRLAIVGLVTIKAVGLVLIFDFTHSLVQAFDLTKSAFSRGMEWALLACLVLAVARFGTAILPRSPLIVAAAAFLVVNVASAFTAENRYVAVFGGQDRLLGLTFVVDMLVLALAVAVAFRSARDWAIGGAGLTLATLLVAGYAVVQVTGNDPVPWADDPRIRPFATLGNPDMFGQYLSVVLGVSLGVAVFEKRIAGRIAGVGVIFIALGIAAVTATRGTALGIAAAVLVLPIVYVRVYGVSRRALLKLVAIGAATVLSLSLVLLASPLGGRVRGTFEGVELTQDRVFGFEVAAKAIADRPLLGWGPDSFGVVYPRFRQVAEVRQFGPLTSDSAHDWVLQAAATTGALGLSTLVALIVASAWLLLARVRAEPAVAAALLLGSVAYWAHGLVTVGAVGVDWFPWLVFGGALALTADQDEPRSKRDLPAWAHGGVLVVALLAATTGWSALAANHEARVAKLAVDLGAGEVALSAAQAAVIGDPGRADYWNDLGRSYSELQRWRLSAGAFIEATRRMPQVATYWMNLAKSRAQQALAGDESGGGKAGALGAARTAVDLDPNSPEPLVVLSDVAYAVGDYAASMEAGASALRLLPTSPSYDGYAARAAIAMSDGASARAGLEALLPVKESALLHVAIAQIALKQSDVSGARVHARRALELEPGNAGAQRILAGIGG